MVAINRFPDDTPEEIEVLQAAAIEAGAAAAVEAKGFAEGGSGMTDLAAEVVRLLEVDNTGIRLMYRDSATIEEKITTLAKELYQAESVKWGPLTRTTARHFDKHGWKFPICVAKTHLSISADPKLLGAPEGHVFPVQEIRVAAGSQQIICLAGDIMTLPGLPRDPNAFEIDLNEDGSVVGLL